MGHCPQSNHHRSHRHCGSFRVRRLQVDMRTITLLIIHCSATPQGVSLSFEDCRHDHIFHRNTKMAVSFRTLTDNYGVTYVSDHYPILLTVLF